MARPSKRLNLADAGAFPPLQGEVTRSKAPQPQTKAWSKKEAEKPGPKSDAPPLRPSSLEDKVKAFWLLFFEKNGGNVFAEVTVKWAWGHIFHSRIDQAKGIYEDFICEMELLGAPQKFFELACTPKAKKIYIQNIRDGLSKMRDMVEGKGEPFQPTLKQLFKGQWFSCDDRYFANNTFEYAYGLLSSGRRDSQKMAEDVWKEWTSKLSKEDRADLDDLNAISEGKCATFEEVIKWGHVRDSVEIFNKFV
jgi:hypothetical protein